MEHRWQVPLALVGGQRGAELTQQLCDHSRDVLQLTLQLLPVRLRFATWRELEERIDLTVRHAPSEVGRHDDSEHAMVPAPRSRKPNRMKIS